MKNLVKVLSILPTAINALGRAWEKSKEWNAKKKIVLFIGLPIIALFFILCVSFFGAANVNIALDLLVEFLNALPL